MKRLWLGLFLIAAASGVLLVSDRDQRRPSTRALPRVALVQHATQAILDEGVQGMVDGLSQNGFVDGKTAEIQPAALQDGAPSCSLWHGPSSIGSAPTP